MADFNTAVAKTLTHEGGYVNNPADPGGATKYGITQADMPGVNIAAITPQMATAYYQEHYWKPLYSQINDQLLAEKLFDMGVLFGVGTAVKLFQTSMESDIHIVSDGNFGPETLADANQYGNLQAFKTTLIQHVVAIVNTKPELHVFGDGWINRINS